MKLYLVAIAAVSAALSMPLHAGNSTALSVQWASTDTHCTEGRGTTSLSYQKKAFAYPAWRGERVYAQAVISSPDKLSDVTLSVSDLSNGKSVIGSENVTLQFVRFVMSDLLDTTRYFQCGYRFDKSVFGQVLIADVLDTAKTYEIPSYRKQPVWMTVNVPSGAATGLYKGRLTVSSSNAGSKSVPFELKVLPDLLPPVHDWSFHLDLWQNPYAVARIEGTPLWSKEHFDALRPVMKILADAGQKSVTATLADRPWNGQTYDAFGSMITKIKKIDGTWIYDYAIFDKWVEFMFSLGIDKQINCYSLIPWAMEFDYYDQATSKMTAVKAPAGSEEYKEYWGSFIKDFAAHLRSKGWFEKTYIAMDERPLEAMQTVLSLLKETEPDLKVSLAGNYHAPVIYDIDDFSEAFVYKKEFPEEVKAKRRQSGLITTFYTCCAEQIPNTFVVSQPAEPTWFGLFAAAEGYDGYLRWAYNSWPADPLVDARFTSWPAGDCFITYPGGCGSIRLAKLVEGIQSYEKVRILRERWEKEGNQRNLDELSGILSHFNSDEVINEGPLKALVAARSFLSTRR